MDQATTFVSLLERSLKERCETEANRGTNLSVMERKSCKGTRELLLSENVSVDFVLVRECQ